MCVWSLRLILSFFLTARPLDSQNCGKWFLNIQCRFHLSSDQDEGILAVEIRDLDASSFLASSNFKACVPLMIQPLLLDSWHYNNGMNFYYEISRGYYFLLRHPKFRSCLSIKRRKRPCIYYSGSSATFHPLLIGDLVFKLNPGPTRIIRIPAIVSSRNDDVNKNTVASTCVRRNIKNLIKITYCHNNPTLLRPLNFCLWNCQSVRNKTAVFQEYLCSNKIDVCALTETWLSSDDEANALLLVTCFMIKQLSPRWGWYRSVVSHRTVRDPSHCWGKDLV